MTPVMLALEAGAIRSSRQGVLLVEYDLTPIAAQSSATSARPGLAAVVLLAAVMLADAGALGRDAPGQRAAREHGADWRG